MPGVPQHSRHDGLKPSRSLEHDQSWLDLTQSLNELCVSSCIVRYLPHLSVAPNRDIEAAFRNIDPNVGHHFSTTSSTEIAGVCPLLRYPSSRSRNRSGSTPEFRARRPKLPDGVFHQRVRVGLPSPSPTRYFTTYKRVRERGHARGNGAARSLVGLGGR